MNAAANDNGVMTTQLLDNGAYVDHHATVSLFPKIPHDTVIIIITLALIENGQLYDGAS